jgi:hypothetical protein
MTMRCNWCGKPISAIEPSTSERGPKDEWLFRWHIRCEGPHREALAGRDPGYLARIEKCHHCGKPINFGGTFYEYADDKGCHFVCANCVPAMYQVKNEKW